MTYCSKPVRTSRVKNRLVLRAFCDGHITACKQRIWRLVRWEPWCVSVIRCVGWLCSELIALVVSSSYRYEIMFYIKFLKWRKIFTALLKFGRLLLIFEGLIARVSGVSRIRNFRIWNLNSWSRIRNFCLWNLNSWSLHDPVGHKLREELWSSVFCGWVKLVWKTVSHYVCFEVCLCWSSVFS